MKKDLLNKLVKKHDQTIEQIEKKFKRLLTNKQSILFENIRTTFLEKLERDENGKVIHSEANFYKVAIIEASFAEMSKTSKKEMVANLLSNVDDIVKFNKNYFAEITGKAEVEKSIPKVNDALAGWLGIKDGKAKENGFIEQLVDDSAVKVAVKNLAMKIVIGQNGFEEAKKQLKDLIEGNPEKLGAFEKHYKTFANDLYSQIDRATGNVMRNDLGLEFAIYEGGLIETSREFCENHNGKIYHISEIKEFKPKRAIPPDYDPITDLGGYNCRHHLNWISNAMAKALGKDISPFVDEAKPKAKEPEKVKEVRLKLDDVVKKIANRRQASKFLKDEYKVKETTFSSELDIDEIKEKIQNVKNLIEEYNLSTNVINKISFKSSKTFYGKVRSKISGPVVDANFGHQTGSVSARKANDKEPAKNLKLPKSAVDEENIRFATTTHEFAHLITTRARKALGYEEEKLREFWNEILKLQTDYRRKIAVTRGNDDDEAGRYYLGRYAHTNTDEFFAESFTQYKLKKKPTYYANEVGKLVDKYFKK